MLREKGLYTEDELSVLLSRAGDLSGQLETALLAARLAVRDGDQEMAGNCVKRANALLNRLGNLGAQEEIRVGRPRTVVQESRDQTLGQIRNAMRLCVPVGTLARDLGISESTFRRRLRRSDCMPDSMLFSQIP
ncbi:MAG: hypothetical protein IKF59_01655 [Lachnospiraceae bacterium]|nr:hypothetical protein [Eubacterium sp.]MBR3186726.1 hypothetical protein [Lachnospiraceae bacterium]